MTDTSTPTAPGDLTQNLIDTDLWTDQMVAEAGIPVVDVPFVTVGGGMGSLILVDFLREAGIETSQIRVLTDLDQPYDSYKYLATNSQIPDHERIRSDAGSVMDNIWGFPSYAWREAWEDKTFAPLWNVLTEPLLTDYWTPRAAQVYRSVDRETARIGWSQMVVKGLVRMVRRRYGGGYFSVLTPPAGTSATKRVAFRSTYVHLSVGYPGVKFLDDLQAYRDTYQDFSHVVAAYEPHPHVYEEALRKPTTVVVRGNGIVASRVLQRLFDDVENNGAQTTVVHLFRNYVSGPQGDKLTFKRKGGDGWAYQGFNFAKAAWGGQYRVKLRNLEGQARADFADSQGGTNTAPRKYWKRQLARNAASGRYVQRVGEVESVTPSANSMIRTVVRTREGQVYEIDADFIVDATGLEAGIREARLLADLLDHGGAGTNPKGRLDVETTCEVRGTQSGPGRIFASGSITLGGYYAPVDSFLGLQHSGLEIHDELARLGFGKKINGFRSISQWWRWARNRPPT